MLHVYIRNVYVFSMPHLCMLCIGSATVTLMQTAYDSTEFNRLGAHKPDWVS